MSRRKQMVDTLVSTMKINPDNYGLNTSPGRIESLGYALAGWLYMLRHQKNTRIMAFASLLIFGFALWLQVDPLRWAILILTVTTVWMAEFLNAAVEAVVNLASPDYHPMAKVAKDVAAASVLLCAVASALVGLLILGPLFAQKLGL